MLGEAKQDTRKLRSAVNKQQFTGTGSAVQGDAVPTAFSLRSHIPTSKLSFHSSLSNPAEATMSIPSQHLLLHSSLYYPKSWLPSTSSTLWLMIRETALRYVVRGRHCSAQNLGRGTASPFIEGREARTRNDELVHLGGAYRKLAQLSERQSDV